MYKTPAKRYRTEEIIKRSRFIITAEHVPTEADVKEFVSDIKKEFSDASHNCWAYVTGPPGDSSRVGMSDDGEPHGTAGKPMLNVLLHSEIGEIAVVVSRYFGGTKLGTGGLVRAYSGSVKKVLEELPVKEKRETLSLSLVLDYSSINSVKRLIGHFDAEIIKERYESDVFLEIELPKNHKILFLANVTDITCGKIKIHIAES
jgi:uncharacterized YigZ family protein